MKKKLLSIALLLAMPSVVGGGSNIRRVLNCRSSWRGGLPLIMKLRWDDMMMKRLIAVLLVWVQVALPGVGWGATYTVCPSGCNYTTLTGAMAVDLNGGDIVEVRAATPGGSITLSETVILGSNDAGVDATSRLYFQCRAGDTCIIDGVGYNAAVRYAIDGNGWITWQRFILRNGTSGSFYASGSVPGIRLVDMVMDGGPGRGFYTTGTSETYASLEMQNVSVSGYTLDSVYMGGTGTTYQAPLINNLTISDGAAKGFVGLAFVSPVIDGLTTVNTGSYGVYLSGMSGTPDIQHVETSGTLADPGFYLLNSALTDGYLAYIDTPDNGGTGLWSNNSSGFAVHYLSSERNTGSGVRIDAGSYNIDLYYPIVDGNTADGFQTDTTHDVSYFFAKSKNNGSATDANSGDGYTGHATDYNILLAYCYAESNLNTAFAYTGTTSGWIYNSTGRFNGSLALPDRGGLWLNNSAVNPTTSTSWTVKNTIVADSYGPELWLATSQAALLGTTLILDNNLYWDSSDPTGAEFATLNGGVAFTAFSSHAAAEPNSQYADPKFASLIDPNLLANSPAINAGALIAGIHDQATPATDIAGTSVLTIPDIGAYELPGGLYFSATGAAGGNGTRALPYNAWDDYVYAGYNLRAGAEVYFYGNLGNLDISGLTDDPNEIMVRPWDKGPHMTPSLFFLSVPPSWADVTVTR